MVCDPDFPKIYACKYLSMISPQRQYFSYDMEKKRLTILKEPQHYAMAHMNQNAGNLAALKISAALPVQRRSVQALNKPVKSRLSCLIALIHAGILQHLHEHKSDLLLDDAVDIFCIHIAVIG